MSKKNFKKYWGKKETVLGDMSDKAFLAYANTVVKHLAPKKSEKILDMGYGEGFLTKKVK